MDRQPVIRWSLDLERRFPFGGSRAKVGGALDRRGRGARGL